MPLKIKAELVVTIGAVQSNHARQTAAACTLLGLKCLIILEQRLKDPPDVIHEFWKYFFR